MVDADRDLKFEACVAKARSDVARIINFFFSLSSLLLARNFKY